MAIILGIDPGSRKLGYGIIKQENQKLTHLDNGVLHIPVDNNNSLPTRLKFIYSNLTSIITKFRPQHFAIEEVFVHKNVSGALKLGQARGAAILAAVNTNLEVAEYSARAVKQAVVGKGSADKYQVQQMIKILLNLPEPPESDAADALAIAICFANTNSSPLNIKCLNKNSVKYSRGRWR